MPHRDHLDEGTIHAWLDGALSAGEAEAVEAHVAGCAACSAAVAEARGLIAASSRILAKLDAVPAGVVPRAAVAPEDATAAPDVAPIDLARRGARPAGRRWLRSTPLRAAAALLLVATGTVVVVRERGTGERAAADTHAVGFAVRKSAAAAGEQSSTAARRQRELTFVAPPVAPPVVPQTSPTPAPGAAAPAEAAPREPSKREADVRRKAAPASVAPSSGAAASAPATARTGPPSTLAAQAAGAPMVAADVAAAGAGTEPSRVPGCYELRLDDWRPAVPAAQAGRGAFPPPSRIALDTTRSDAPPVAPGDSGFVVRALPGSAPDAHGYAYWVPVPPDSVRVVWSDGTAGVELRARVEREGLRGTAATFSDDERRPVQRAATRARRTGCGAR